MPTVAPILARSRLPLGRAKPPEDIFLAAPAPPGPVPILPEPSPHSDIRPDIFSAASPPVSTAQSKMDNTDPNIWIPRNIEKQRANGNHPTTQAQGKPSRRSLMQPQLRAAGHPFFPTLHEWGTDGVPVDCGPDWSWDVIEHAVERGPHRSAMEKENIALVHEDVQYQVDAGFSRIVLWSDLQELRPSKLKISPMAVVPQKDRRGRLILDLSFPVYPERTKSQ
jgi:hypothetical protein